MRRSDAGTLVRWTAIIDGLKVWNRLVGNVRLRSLMHWLDILCPETSDRGAKVVGGAVIWDDNIGELAFFIGGPLGGLALVKIGLGPASRDGPLEPQFPQR